MKTTTLTLTAKRETIFPLDWCRRQGLERGGKVEVVDGGHGTLLIRPVRPVSRDEIKTLLSQPAASDHTPRQVKAIVARALRKVRQESNGH